MERKIIVLLVAMLVLVAGWGYVQGYWGKLSHRNGNAVAAQQRALDRLLGPDMAFDSAAADNVTSYAANAADSIKWTDLAKARAAGQRDTMSVSYTTGIAKRDGANITITGYIFPLQSAAEQAHFLLSAYPPSCPYCLPAGPAELIDVRSADAVPFTYKAVTLKGALHLIRKPEELQEGVFYRLTDATQVN